MTPITPAPATHPSGDKRFKLPDRAITKHNGSGIMHIIDGRRRKITEGMLNRVEAGIRCDDPCLSCSTHALGQMPLRVELRVSDGTLLDVVSR